MEELKFTWHSVVSLWCIFRGNEEKFNKHLIRMDEINEKLGR